MQTSRTLTAGHRDEQGRLVVTDDRGVQHVDVLPARMFPLTDPDGWLTLRDRQGRELLCLCGMDAVAAELRPLIEEELNRLVFTPVITGIRRTTPFGDHVRMFIETDRGVTDITVASADIHRLAGNRILLKDVHGIRYLIPDWHALKPQDRRLLDVYL
ncbi:MAG: DUF1854 domain-containing protein [Akkermansiaceae bacterium]|jgi:hypothetical protein|nr:DUF1854 domain-containing protein [Akkermansiaceae bacterium]